jgi:hypothetical protein
MAERSKLIASNVGTANGVSQLLRIPSLLILLCCPIVLAGCQHPLTPSVARHQTAAAIYASVDATPVALVGKTIQFPAPALEGEDYVSELGLPEGPNPAAQSPVASVQKKPDCLALQLGDALCLALKTFTGR